MTRLSEILDQMTTVLNDLKTVMDAEQQQLSAGHINGSQLQRITEEKSSLLATLDYLEQQRRPEHDATRSATMRLLNAGRLSPRKHSTYATSTSTMVGCWKGRSSVINKQYKC